jgi:glycosyltransferase involved in cell wall biosynthesis
MKIALVHDQLGEFGGAERVLVAMSELWPEAPIYTAYCKKGSAAWERFKGKDIRTSWMQHLYPLASPLRFLAPAIWNSFDFSEYDVVISSSSWYVTKGFTKKGKATEICYCHTPPRWLYGYPTSVNWQKYPIVRAYATVVGFFMRQYDYNAAQRVDYFIANSEETKRRIQKFYRRDSTVIYPPIDLPNIPKVKRGKYYLFVSRPVGGKGLELARAASKKLGFPLKVVGATGTHVSDTELARLYAGAKAFLALATDEDFGMTPVEAMSMGTPVIAYAGGGYTESVVDGSTGILFRKPTAESLIEAIKKFEKTKIDTRNCISQAKKFSKERFKAELQDFVEEKYKKRE